MAMSHNPINQSVQKYRDALRAAGLGPVQIWLPDTRREGVLEEGRRQSLLFANAEADEAEMDLLSDEGLNDIEGWSD